MITY
ncbi:hypothetical protein YPPY95_4565, partial [Yersinia pestis PY-95]|jgi:hypothetical protein